MQRREATVMLSGGALALAFPTSAQAAMVRRRDAFFSVLVEELENSGGSENVVNLAGAAEALFDSLDSARVRLTEGQLSEAEYEAQLEARMAEIDERTRGQAFRLDLQDGPVFVFIPLWRFAGRSGPDLGPGHEPTWDGDPRDFEGDHEALFGPVPR